MKWHVLVNDRAVEIDPGHLDAVAEVEPGVYSVLQDGQPASATAHEADLAQ